MEGHKPSNKPNCLNVCSFLLKHIHINSKSRENAHFSLSLWFSRAVYSTLFDTETAIYIISHAKQLDFKNYWCSPNHSFCVLYYLPQCITITMKCLHFSISQTFFIHLQWIPIIASCSFILSGQTGISPNSHAQTRKAGEIEATKKPMATSKKLWSSMTDGWNGTQGNKCPTHFTSLSFKPNYLSYWNVKQRFNGVMRPDFSKCWLILWEEWW